MFLNKKNDLQPEDNSERWEIKIPDLIYYSIHLLCLM